MRNNRKKLARLLVAALLAFMMTLSLTACQVEIPGVGTININDGNTPASGNVPDGSGTDGDGIGGEPGAYDNSLNLLRQWLDERQQDERFAVAYIGDIDGKLSDLAVPLRDWMNDKAPMLCAQYPFIRNIPQERVVGDSGSLFCVVPRDPDATVVVNRIRWSEAKGNYETIKELYRSQNGEPILLFVFYELEKTPFETTELRLTDHYGDIVDHGIQIIRLYPHLRNGDHAVQKRHSLFMKLLRLQVQMTAISLCAFQCRKYRATDTHGGIEGPVVLSHDRVHTLEAETGYLAELKGVVPQDIHAACAKMVIDLRGGGGGDLEGSQ